MHVGHRGIVWGAAAALGVAWLATGTVSRADDFDDRLDRIDAALRTNPRRALPQALDSCLRQRKHAVQLYRVGERARAERSLAYCNQILGISDQTLPESHEPTIDEIQAAAAAEVEAALELEPDLAHGLEVYRGCALCHTPEGWGLSGTVPQIAGQHRTVIIKQLADIRAGNRGNVAMAPYATVEVIGGVQAVADVAGYIETLEISTDVAKGPGKDLERGEKLYAETCAGCHGDRGQGNAEAFVPRLHAQHYDYLVRQFQRIQDGTRHNADPTMRERIADFDEADTRAVIDYVSRLEPEPQLQAPPGWRNPDFAK